MYLSLYLVEVFQPPTVDIDRPALLAALNVLKGLSRRHVPFKDFANALSGIDTGGVKLNHSSTRRMLSPKVVFQKRIHPVEKTPSDSDLHKRMKRALSYLEDCCQLHSSLKAKLLGKSGSSLQILIDSVGLVLHSIMHFLNPAGKACAEIFPELLSSLISKTQFTEA
jgi:hypothetical protein